VGLGALHEPAADGEANHDLTDAHQSAAGPHSADSVGAVRACVRATLDRRAKQPPAASNGANYVASRR
ncbi:MAG: hypothetical protein RL701_1957, partial [Pseudomonadota bacterium]